MTERSYFEQIRRRPTDQAAAAARQALEDVPEMPSMNDPAAVRRGVEALIGGARAAVTGAPGVVKNVVMGAAGGPADALDTMVKKVGSVANWAVDQGAKASGHEPTSGFGMGAPDTAPKVFAGLNQPERIVPDVPIDHESLAAGLARGISTFVSLYGPAAIAFGAMGATGLTGNVMAGAFADMMAFENKKGTIADVLRDLGLDNEFTRFTSGELSDNEWEASLKAALEGVALGALDPVIRGVARGVRRWPELATRRLKRPDAEHKPAAADHSGAVAAPAGGQP